MSDIDWPVEQERTPPQEREPYPHGFTVSRSEAFDSILKQLRKMDAKNVQLDTGAEHQKRNPNKPYANASFDDPGIVVRFDRDGQQYAMAMDKWDNPRDNGRAIALTLKAKQALTRYGVETVESEFRTLQLPSAGEDVAVGNIPPHVILGVDRDADNREVKEAFREKVKFAHPDNGGSDEEFSRVQNAREAMLE